MSGLHPLVVHMPIAVVLLWPVVDVVGLLLRRPDVSWTAVGLLALAVLASLAGTVTGQAAYDVAIASGRAPELLDAHASPAELLPWMLLALVALRTAGVNKLGRSAHVAAILAGAGAAAWVTWVGYTGGRLVYEQGVGVSSSAPRAMP